MGPVAGRKQGIFAQKQSILLCRYLQGISIPGPSEAGGESCVHHKMCKTHTCEGGDATEGL